MLNIKIITLEGLQFEGKIKEATIPTKDGEITVLPNHAPLISLLKEGILVLRGGDTQSQKFKMTEGFLEIRPAREHPDSRERESEVILLSDTVEKIE